MSKTDFDVKLSSLNRKITSNKTKHVLVENELEKQKAFDLSYFIGTSHFEENGAQNYLAFQSIHRYFKIRNHGNHGNPKDYLMKLLHLMLALITVLLHGLIIMAAK